MSNSLIGGGAITPAPVPNSGLKTSEAPKSVPEQKPVNEANQIAQATLSASTLEANTSKIIFATQLPSTTDKASHVFTDVVEHHKEAEVSEEESKETKEEALTSEQKLNLTIAEYRSTHEPFWNGFKENLNKRREWAAAKHNKDNEFLQKFVQLGTVLETTEQLFQEKLAKEKNAWEAFDSDEFRNFLVALKDVAAYENLNLKNLTGDYKDRKGNVRHTLYEISDIKDAGKLLTVCNPIIYFQRLIRIGSLLKEAVKYSSSETRKPLSQAASYAIEVANKLNLHDKEEGDFLAFQAHLVAFHSIAPEALGESDININQLQKEHKKKAKDLLRGHLDSIKKLEKKLKSEPHPPSSQYLSQEVDQLEINIKNLIDTPNSEQLSILKNQLEHKKDQLKYTQQLEEHRKTVNQILVYLHSNSPIARSALEKSKELPKLVKEAVYVLNDEKILELTQALENYKQLQKSTVKEEQDEQKVFLDLRDIVKYFTDPENSFLLKLTNSNFLLQATLDQAKIAYFRSLSWEDIVFGHIVNLETVLESIPEDEFIKKQLDDHLTFFSTTIDEINHLEKIQDRIGEERQALTDKKRALTNRLELLDSPSGIEYLKRIHNPKLNALIEKGHHVAFASEKAELKNALESYKTLHKHAKKYRDYLKFDWNASQLGQLIQFFSKDSPAIQKRVEESRELKKLLKEAKLIYFHSLGLEDALTLDHQDNVLAPQHLGMTEATYTEKFTQTLTKALADIEQTSKLVKKDPTDKSRAQELRKQYDNLEKILTHLQVADLDETIISKSLADKKVRSLVNQANLVYFRQMSLQDILDEKHFGTIPEKEYVKKFSDVLTKALHHFEQAQILIERNHLDPQLKADVDKQRNSLLEVLRQLDAYNQESSTILKALENKPVQSLIDQARHAAFNQKKAELRLALTNYKKLSTKTKENAEIQREINHLRNLVELFETDVVARKRLENSRELKKFVEEANQIIRQK